MTNIFLHLTGGDNGSGPQYLELSGFLSIIVPPLLTVLGLAVTYWWHARCHYPRCYRTGRYPFHHYRLCRRHHPQTTQPVDRHVAALHQEDARGRHL